MIIEVQIDFNSDEAIYMQLRNQIILGVATSQIQEGDMLPSVRQLADDIGINMHTVNKAYKILVSEGVVEQMKKGYAISATTPPKISEIRLMEIKNQVEELLIDASIFEIDLENILIEKAKELKGESYHD